MTNVEKGEGRLGGVFSSILQNSILKFGERSRVRINFLMTVAIPSNLKLKRWTVKREQLSNIYFTWSSNYLRGKTM